MNNKKPGRPRVQNKARLSRATDIVILSQETRAHLIEGIRRIKELIGSSEPRTMVNDPAVRELVIEFYQDALILLKEPQNEKYADDLMYYFELVMWIGGKQANLSDTQIEKNMPDNLAGFQKAIEEVEGFEELIEKESHDRLEKAESVNLHTMASLIYQVAREAVSKNTFQQVEGTLFPTYPFQKGNASGEIQLRPINMDDLDQMLLPPARVEEFVTKMWQQREELSDLDADVLDVLCHIWLEQVNTPNDWAYADVDKLASLRGIKKQIRSDGKEGSYPKKARTSLLRALTHIQNLWLNVGQMEIYEGDKDSGRRRKTIKKDVQSRAFIISDRVGQLRIDGFMDVQSFRFQPGVLFGTYLFGPGRQTALLSAQAIQYDPYRQKWEKRLARYLSWQWRVQARRSDYMRPYRVSTLLDAVGTEDYKNRPDRIRERLERTLDVLEQDEVISRWQYDRWDENDADQQNWFEIWKKATILIEPPESIIDWYKSIEKPPKSEHEARLLERPASLEIGAGSPEPEALAHMIKDHRKKLGLSQIEASEALEVAQSYFSKLERGVAKASPEIIERIANWIKKTSTTPDLD
jgi:DNA-binding XRE family transcriptional regulator